MAGTSDPIVEDIVAVIIANDGVKHLQAYLARGRRFSGLSDPFDLVKEDLEVVFAVIGKICDELT
jgi:hypothetical protein